MCALACFATQHAHAVRHRAGRRRALRHGEQQDDEDDEGQQLGRWAHTGGVLCETVRKRLLGLLRRRGQARTARSQRQSQSGLHHGSGTYSGSSFAGGGLYGALGFSRGKPHLLPLVTCFS